MPHCTSQTSTATTSPHWISAQSFSSLEYFHFPHKAPHVISVMFGRLLPFHPSKCSTYSIFTPEPLSTSAVSLETRDLYCQRNRNAKASCKMYAGTCKEQTKGTQSVLCKYFGFKESGRYFIHHPRQARKRILEKSFARATDISHCKEREPEEEEEEKFPEHLIITVRGSLLCSAPQVHSERWPWMLP